MGRRFRLVTLCLILAFMVTGCAKKRHDTSDASQYVHRYEQFRQNYDAQGFYVQDEDFDDDGEVGQTGRKTKNWNGKPPKGDSAVTNIVLARAHKGLGTPYHFGGTTPGGFDCSGFVQWAYKGAGIKLPRTAQEQSLAGYKIRDKSQLRAGDIVAFRRRGGYHTGIYIGNGKFIHAPRRNQTVRVESMDTDYFARNYIGGRRIDGSRRSAQLAQATQKEDKEYQSSGKRKSKKQPSVSRASSKKEKASSKSKSSKKEQASSKSRSSKKEQASSKSRSDKKEQASSKSRNSKKEKASQESRSSKKQDTSRSKGASGSKDSAGKKDSKQKDTSASQSKPAKKKQDTSQAKSKDTSSASSSKKSQPEVKQQERKIEVRRSSKSSSGSSSSDQKKKD